MSERKIWIRVEKEKENTISGGAVWCGNLCCWLEPYTPPVAGWPPPRYDDPAKCGDPERMILKWSQGAGGSSYWEERAKAWTPGRAWLEQPPQPQRQKSPAEIAWENTKDLPWASGKEMFLRGYYEGTKGKP